MSLVTVLIILAITALFLYLMNSYVLTEPKSKKLFNIVVVITVLVILLILWLLPILHVHVGR